MTAEELNAIKEYYNAHARHIQDDIGLLIAEVERLSAKLQRLDDAAKATYEIDTAALANAKGKK